MAVLFTGMHDKAFNVFQRSKFDTKGIIIADNSKSTFIGTIRQLLLYVFGKSIMTTNYTALLCYVNVNIGRETHLAADQCSLLVID